MTLIELFMAGVGVTAGVAAVHAAFPHGWVLAVLAFPLGMVLGLIATFPFIVLTGLTAFGLMPVEEYLNKRSEILYSAFETLCGIILLMVLVLVPFAVYVLILGGTDRLLTWFGW